MNDLPVLSIATCVAFLGCAISVAATIIAYRKSPSDVPIKLDELRATAKTLVVEEGSLRYPNQAELIKETVAAVRGINRRMHRTERLLSEEKPVLAARAEKMFACP